MKYRAVCFERRVATRDGRPCVQDHCGHIHDLLMDALRCTLEGPTPFDGVWEVAVLDSQGRAHAYRQDLPTCACHLVTSGGPHAHAPISVALFDPVYLDTE